MSLKASHCKPMRMLNHPALNRVVKQADDTQEAASTESAGGASDSESEEASAFDAALTDAVSNSDDDGDVASAGLSDIAAASSDAESDATPSGAQADEPPTTNDTGSNGQDEGQLGTHA